MGLPFEPGFEPEALLLSVGLVNGVHGSKFLATTTRHGTGMAVGAFYLSLATELQVHLSP